MYKIKRSKMTNALYLFINETQAIRLTNFSPNHLWRDTSWPKGKVLDMTGFEHTFEDTGNTFGEE